MKCIRCNGLMVSDKVYGVEEALFDTSIWRCLNCGESVDLTILQNRKILRKELQPLSPHAA